MLQSYLPALVFLGLGALFAAVFLAAGAFIAPRHRTNAHKNESYECGLPSEMKKEFRFGVSFYLIAMLFLLFDLEVIFLYPIAVQLGALGVFALIEVAVFITLLFVALVYVWRRGALEWT